MFHFAYKDSYQINDLEAAKDCFEYCVSSLHKGYPVMSEKLKIHLLLHLVDDMENFGPAVSFCTERYSFEFMMCKKLLIFCSRCESFNSNVRMHNVFSNRRAPSRDIATNFAVLSYLRFICDGGMIANGKM